MAGPWHDLNQVFRNRMALWTQTPIAWDGFNGAPYVPQNNEAWVRPNPVEVVRDQTSMGRNGLVQIEGFYDVQCFFPRETGMVEVDAICDALAALYRNHDSGAVSFMEPERVLVGNEPGGWYQVNVMINWIVLDHAPAGPIEDVEVAVITQASHGFSAGDAVYVASTQWIKAQADSTATRAHGVVSAVNGSEFIVASGGFVYLPNHGHGQGVTLYLSTATAGSMTTTVPSAGVTQELGRATDANYVLLDLKAHST